MVAAVSTLTVRAAGSGLTVAFGLDRLCHRLGAAAAGHVFDLEQHEKSPLFGSHAEQDGPSNDGKVKGHMQGFILLTFLSLEA